MPPVRRSKRIQQNAPPVNSARPGHATSSPNLARKPKSKLSYLQRSENDTRADPNLSTGLFRLPRELFDEIVTHLSPTAKVCLTLSCKAALRAIGPLSWGMFRRNHQPWRQASDITLCELLNRDSLELEYCLRCEILHPPLKPPHRHRSTKFTKVCFGQEASIDYWPQTLLGGYSVVLAHVEQAFQSRPADLSQNPPVDLFSNDFTVPQGPLNYRLRSSASWIDGSLVLQQEYHLSTSSGSPLRVVDITSLPLRVCAHLTTSTSPPPGAYRSTKTSANGPVLTHAIDTAFPTRLRRGIAGMKTFRKPTPSEEAQMTAAEHEPRFIWRCRSCPTKFRVRYSSAKDGKFIVTAWHCFGREMWKALEYWKMFVRREGPSLGPKKRNSEFYVVPRAVSNFTVK